jgi:hypothetical protein
MASDESSSTIELPDISGNGSDFDDDDEEQEDGTARFVSNINFVPRKILILHVRAHQSP